VLEFEFNGRRYGVERSNSDSKLEDITDKIKPLATGLAEVPRACERLLCLTYRQFKNSFCAEQKELAFLNFPAAMRQEEVARMLGMDRLKSAEETAKERRASYRIKVEALERTLGNLQDIEREKKDAETRLKSIEETLCKLKDAQEKLAQKVGPAAELRKVAERWNELTADMNVVRSEA
jgi:DNA repair exonuclease SbcCD ATPase subunit